VNKTFKDLKKFWKNKKIFITGHTGFKGTWLTIFLKLLGANISGY
jgi:CDP-glucose 4,6-dehydratase